MPCLHVITHRFFFVFSKAPFDIHFQAKWRWAGDVGNKLTSLMRSACNFESTEYTLIEVSQTQTMLLILCNKHLFLITCYLLRTRFIISGYNFCWAILSVRVRTQTEFSFTNKINIHTWNLPLRSSTYTCSTHYRKRAD